MTATVLTLKWTTSRGRDTYGYNICTLTDTDTQERYRCMGGGYDMVGTVFAQWLSDVHFASLSILAKDRAYYVDRSEGHERRDYADGGLYGLSYYSRANGDRAHFSLDGACGLESMLRIAEAIGLKVKATLSPRGAYIGFVVS